MALKDFLWQESQSREIAGINEVAADLVSTLNDQSVIAVLFYGSCLRTGEIEDKILDFYLVVDNYTHAYGAGWKAIANKLIPPNVFYRETETSKGLMRSKYAIISLADLAYGTSRKCLNVSLWARFSQPLQIVYLRDELQKEKVLTSLAAAPVTLIKNILPLMPQRFSIAALWSTAFTATYKAELRSEKSDKGTEIYETYAERYSQIMPLLCQSIPALSAVSDQPNQLEYFLPHNRSKKQKTQARMLWGLRRIHGKFLSVARLLKATTTFEGGADYIVWKISRHSGVTITLTPWQRKHPILAGFGLFLQLRKKGAFR